MFSIFTSGVTLPNTAIDLSPATTPILHESICYLRIVPPPPLGRRARPLSLVFCMLRFVAIFRNRRRAVRVPPSVATVFPVQIFRGRFYEAGGVVDEVSRRAAPSSGDWRHRPVSRKLEKFWKYEITKRRTSKLLNDYIPKLLARGFRCDWYTTTGINKTTSPTEYKRNT